jgi:hypothetical protein
MRSRYDWYFAMRQILIHWQRYKWMGGDLHDVSKSRGVHLEGRRTSPVTTPLRPVRNPSTLHHTPPPSRSNRSKRSRSGTVCSYEFGWNDRSALEDARESACRWETMMDLCYGEGVSGCAQHRGGVRTLRAREVTARTNLVTS